MKIFDVKKTWDLLYDLKWHIQDHDNKFQFNGILKSVKPYELTFYICGPTVGSNIRGTYTLPVGSQFTLYKMRLDADNKDWTFAGNNLTFKDIAKNDDNKEEKEMKLDLWKDCVIKENAWVVNNQIKTGDTIYRLKTDAIDIKGNMTIANTAFGVIRVEFTNSDENTDGFNIAITPEMRVFKTDSQDDPGLLVQRQVCEFNPELRVGKLYRFTKSDSESSFTNVMHVKSITDNSIEVDIINTITDLDNTSFIKLIGKAFDITELLEYKFKEI